MDLRGKIHRLELQDFKSYRGRHTVGPFYDFTAIIGPHASEKSSVIDALYFVLDIPGTKDPHDLICAIDDKDLTRTAYVQLFYVARDNTELSFIHHVSISTGSTYGFNGSKVSAMIYRKKLELVGIVEEVRSFLAFQGDFKWIPWKTPKELGQLIEKISGADKFNTQCEELEIKKLMAKKKLASVCQNYKMISKLLEQKKEQKEEAEKHLHLQGALKDLKRSYILWQLSNIEKDINQTDQTLQKKTLLGKLLKIQKEFELDIGEDDKIRDWLKEMVEIELQTKLDKWKSWEENLNNSLSKLEKERNSVEGDINKLKRKRPLVSKDTNIQNLKSLKKHILQQITLETNGDPMENREKEEAGFKQRLDSLISEIKQTTPNLKAPQQYKALEEKKQAAFQEYISANNEVERVTDAFKSTSLKRHTQFMKASNHISLQVMQIYEKLTADSTRELSGTACLKVWNDKPYRCEIKYIAVPPSKRFCDMEQLSGEERTVAAIALLFAIHSYRHMPFFILDEVDAMLDDENAAKVASFIRENSIPSYGVHERNNQRCQCLVVSVKDKFYDRAQVLIGVHRDHRKGLSLLYCR